jgi:ribonuclease P protein component
VLKKPNRLTHAKDFKKLGVFGRTVFGPFMTMRVMTINGIGPKVAFITSTKAMKRAVDRNRIKRRMRAIIAGEMAKIPKNLHVLFILKPEALKTTTVELIAETTRLLGKIEEALKKPATLSPRARKIREKRTKVG